MREYIAQVPSSPQWLYLKEMNQNTLPQNILKEEISKKFDIKDAFDEYCD